MRMSVALLVSLALVVWFMVVECKNVSMKSRSIANGITTGTIGTTAVKEMQLRTGIYYITLCIAGAQNL